MFNLEQAIADWRQNMLAAGIDTPVPLEELELHLREEMERQVRAGQDPQQAFAAATQQIGPANSLNTEFLKLNLHKSMKPIVKTLAGIAVILIGMALVMPALAKLNHNFNIPSPLIAFLMLGTVLATTGAHVLLHTVAMRLRRSKC